MKTFWLRFGATIFLAGFLSACATRPMSIGRKGLLDRDPASSDNDEIASVTLRDGDSDEAAANRYRPREGEQVRLHGEWQWPLKNVAISSSYGDRGSKFHQGVDLRAATGTKVFAAADGEVVYVGSKIRGYGRMVVLKHAGNFYSVYAHHSRNVVKAGRRVKRGQLIAYSGKSGHVSGPHLHFEVRRGTQSFDPEYALNLNIREYASNRKVAGSSDKN